MPMKAGPIAIRHLNHRRLVRSGLVEQNGAVAILRLPFLVHNPPLGQQISRMGRTHSMQRGLAVGATLVAQGETMESEPGMGSKMLSRPGASSFQVIEVVLVRQPFHHRLHLDLEPHVVES